MRRELFRRSECNGLSTTRSGTVGVAHIFRLDPSDPVVYIPSHHLSVIKLPDDASDRLEFLRLYLQSAFARAYFWAFASGKGQKEISKWSIKTLPIAQTKDPQAVATAVVSVETEIRDLRWKIEDKKLEKARLLDQAIRGEDGGSAC
jgi:restriction endonuclease S subunit